MFDAYVSTIMNADGLGKPKQGSDLTRSLTCLTISVRSSFQGIGFTLSLLYESAHNYRRLGKKSET